MVDIAIIVLYLAGMIAVGWWGKRRAVSQADFLVAGRRLGPLMYAGTMAAVVLGGASTIGGVGLGYQYGISGMWLVVSIGAGVLLLSLAFAPTVARVKVFTVSQMLELRYGPGSSVLSGLVMWAYTLMLAVTSTIAFATIFTVVFDIGRVWSIVLGGAIVVLYSALGGMWSITLTDFVQFIIKTIGIFVILLPVTLIRAGGFEGILAKLGPPALNVTTIGVGTIVTYFVTYFFGLLIGQDIWQRVFTARSPGVARYAGGISGLYCLAYGVAGALIGTAAHAIIPNIANRNDVYAEIVRQVLPVGIVGLVLAAALSAVMSTASGALIATATVARHDIVSRTIAWSRKDKSQARDEIAGNRLYVIGFGIVVILIASVLKDVVAALTVAYDILVGGLLIPILGGLIWRRATLTGAVAAMIAGTVGSLGTMFVLGDIYANEPVFVGLSAGLVAFVGGSFASKPTPAAVLTQWRARSRAERAG